MPSINNSIFDIIAPLLSLLSGRGEDNTRVCILLMCRAFRHDATIQRLDRFTCIMMTQHYYCVGVAVLCTKLTYR